MAFVLIQRNVTSKVMITEIIVVSINVETTLSTSASTDVTQ